MKLDSFTTCALFVIGFSQFRANVSLCSIAHFLYHLLPISAETLSNAHRNQWLNSIHQCYTLSSWNKLKFHASTSYLCFWHPLIVNFVFKIKNKELFLCESNCDSIWHETQCPNENKVISDENSKQRHEHRHESRIQSQQMIMAGCVDVFSTNLVSIAFRA